MKNYIHIIINPGFIFILLLANACNQTGKSPPGPPAGPSTENSIVNMQNNPVYPLLVKLYTADNILLISHTGIAHTDDDERINTEPVVDNRLNRSMIIDEKILNGKNKNELIKIIALPVNYDSVMSARCFDPHHAIILYKKDSISYLNLCFTCKNYSVSKDLKSATKNFELDNTKWQMLYDLFKQNNIR